MDRVKICEKTGVMHGAFSAASTGGVEAVPVEPKEKKARAVYVSLRVTPEEKARLEHEAAGMSISAYVRERVFGEAARPRKTRGKFPVKDHEALARVLRALGRSNLAQDFDALSWAVRDGSVHLDPESARALQQACAEISAMHRDLITALGLKARV
ncbi:MAG: hypothetical protein MI921_26335 [Cytophagales bacterium]|nr:hypothetical protein [Cytophagales bacterium]